jgi:hypothetical protein
MSVIVTESLAKGLRKRVLREASNSFESRQNILDNFRPKSRRNGAKYRELTKCIKKFLGNNIISTWEFNEGKKRDYSVINYWSAESGSLVAESVIITRKSPLDLQSGILCRVTNHACERIYERMNTTDTQIVKNEFASCSDIILELENALNQEVILIKSILIPTKRGIYVLIKDEDDIWNIVTWINKEIFDLDQSQYYHNCVNGDFFEVCVKPKCKNITIRKKLQLH